MSIDRENLWAEAFRFYKSGVDGAKPLQVCFSGDTEEIGVDSGGPKREFFQLLSNKIAQTTTGFFEGAGDKMLPVMKGPSLQLGHFRIIGNIIAHSIINGAIGNCL